ncbi:sensor histidine kinase [Larsenimonas suaedae]|uniref:histidine kinase n=1 Tax=Larsenimonas suaedae TaxID=1851019 RepID=A0ABU1GUL1_9GAMM|nr:ATP-binding protein [Larsenimonas suaedae]MCM2971943.1 ATP-binding protein [Larsenimonas suaedae]MDR5895495.1 ATP-binding protein [Larsenimonas suaedae]
MNVTITDTGPGIDKHTLDHLATPFVQGETATSAGALGYGLGLSIARSIVMAHRGRLSLENRPGGGLQVVMVLPAC